MNTPESENYQYLPKKPSPQVEDLFKSLNISHQDRENIQSEFYNISKIVYENPDEISNDTVMKIRLGETNSNSFTIQNDKEWDIIGKYLDFIEKYPDWVKIWRTLTAYYNPTQL